MDFILQPVPTSVFNYAIASAGKVVLSKGTLSGTTGVAATVASIMSNDPVASSVTVSGASVGGALNIVSSGGVSYLNGSVEGSTSNAYIQSNDVNTVPNQNFPIANTSLFRSYAVNTYSAGMTTQQNIYIPPNTNPTFAGGSAVQGIMYIDTPNQVKFAGNFNLQGFIVFASSGTATTDSLTFLGNVSTSAVPAGSQFDTVRAVSGIAILAPTAAVSMSGSATSSISGNIIANTFSMAGASSLTVNTGTLMTLSNGANSMVISTSKTLKFSATGQNDQPNSGVAYNQYFAPSPATYQEILP
jgi:hypothetical protein